MPLPWLQHRLPATQGGSRVSCNFSIFLDVTFVVLDVTFRTYPTYPTCATYPNQSRSQALRKRRERAH